MNLVQQEDLKLKRSSMNFLQNFATLPARVLATEGQWAPLQKLLKAFFPKTIKSWWFNNIRKQDWSVLASEKLIGTIPADIAIPKFKQVPDNYRSVKL